MSVYICFVFSATLRPFLDNLRLGRAAGPLCAGYWKTFTLGRLGHSDCCHNSHDCYDEPLGEVSSSDLGRRDSWRFVHDNPRAYPKRCSLPPLNCRCPDSVAYWLQLNFRYTSRTQAENAGSRGAGSVPGCPSHRDGSRNSHI